MFDKHPAEMNLQEKLEAIAFILRDNSLYPAIGAVLNDYDGHSEQSMLIRESKKMVVRAFSKSIEKLIQ
jgi:hypothetical protein